MSLPAKGTAVADTELSAVLKTVLTSLEAKEAPTRIAALELLSELASTKSAVREVGFLDSFARTRSPLDALTAWSCLGLLHSAVTPSALIPPPLSPPPPSPHPARPCGQAFLVPMIGAVLERLSDKDKAVCAAADKTLPVLAECISPNAVGFTMPVLFGQITIKQKWQTR